MSFGLDLLEKPLVDKKLREVHRQIRLHLQSHDFDQTTRLLQKHLDAGDIVSCRKLGFHDENSLTLQGFFTKDGSTVEWLRIKPADEAKLRQEFTFALWGINKREDAHRFLKQWVKYAAHIEDKVPVIRALVNLSYFLTLAGHSGGLESAQSACDLAKENDLRWYGISRTLLGYVLYLNGMWEESTREFCQSMFIQRDVNDVERTEYPHFFLNEFYLSLGSFEFVIERIRSYREREKGVSQLDRGIQELSLGKALLMSGDTLKALVHFESSVLAIKNAKQLDELPRPLIGMASALRQLNKVEDAKNVLDTAGGYIVEWGLQLYQVDWLQEWAALQRHTLNYNDADVHHTAAVTLGNRISYRPWMWKESRSPNALMLASLISIADPCLTQIMPKSEISRDLSFAQLQLPRNEQTYSDLYVEVLKHQEGIRKDYAQLLEQSFNNLIKGFPGSKETATLEQKKQLAKWINSQLTPLGLAIKCPVKNRPVAIVAGMNQKLDTIGRFTFVYYAADGTADQSIKFKNFPSTVELAPRENRVPAAKPTTF